MADYPDTNADFIETERRAFKATGNVMHVWAAYSLARVVKTPPPEWVLKYLDRCGRAILAISNDAAKSGGKDRGPEVMRALHLKGSDLTGYHGEWMTYGMNVRHRMRRGDKEHFAIEAVAADMKISYSTVQRGWELYDDTFPGEAILPQDAVKE